jgi:hypothetical protein
MTSRFVVKIAQDGVQEPVLVDLGDMDQDAAEHFVAQLREDTQEAREVGVPLLSTPLTGHENGVLAFDPRGIATIDLEVRPEH